MICEFSSIKLILWNWHNMTSQLTSVIFKSSMQPSTRYLFWYWIHFFFNGCSMFFEDVVLVVKNPSAKAGDVGDAGSIPRSGRSPGEVHGNPLHAYSILPGESHGQRSLVGCIVHRVAKSWTQLKRISTRMHKALHTKKVNHRISIISQ